MIETTDMYYDGDHISIYNETDAYHKMKKSEYSGMFGDYSTFSDEMEEISDIKFGDDEESADE